MTWLQVSIQGYALWVNDGPDNAKQLSSWHRYIIDVIMKSCKRNILDYDVWIRIQNMNWYHHSSLVFILYIYIYIWSHGYIHKGVTWPLLEFNSLVCITHREPMLERYRYNLGYMHQNCLGTLLPLFLTETVRDIVPRLRLFIKEN